MENKIYSVACAGFGATVDAYAYDEVRQRLWFLSMVGTQTATKAIWAAILKKNPVPALIKEEQPETEQEQPRPRSIRALVPRETAASWTAKQVRLSLSGAYHTLLYPAVAYPNYKEDHNYFLMLVREQDKPATQYYQFVSQRCHLPLHPSWSNWLWDWARMQTGMVTNLSGIGIDAWLCRNDFGTLKPDLTFAIRQTQLPIPEVFHAT